MREKGSYVLVVRRRGADEIECPLHFFCRTLTTLWYIFRGFPTLAMFHECRWKTVDKRYSSPLKVGNHSMHIEGLNFTGKTSATVIR